MSSPFALKSGITFVGIRNKREVKDYKPLLGALGTDLRALASFVGRTFANVDIHQYHVQLYCKTGHRSSFHKLSGKHLKVMFGNTVSLAVGIGIGIYIAQNYNIPDIKKMVSKGLQLATNLEKAARKDEA